MGMVAKILSAASLGFDGRVIEVESDATKGLPALQIVGMGSKAIDEAKERVRSAITNSLLEFPARRITINLAPAELPKDGTQYDLPIALAILVSSGQLRQDEVDQALFVGELALDGSVRPIRQAIIAAEMAKARPNTILYVPEDNVQQAQMVNGLTVIGVSSLKQLFLHLKKELLITPPEAVPIAMQATPTPTQLLDDVHGQEQAKRALIIAAAGHHNLLMSGSPGAGKTMLARTLLSLLPPLSDEEQIAVTKLHSLAGEAMNAIVTTRPFRSPHHTASRISLIGGGTRPKPGEISLAHHGVLFLDEIPEYPRTTLEALRQPLEDHQVAVTRANGHVTYPANFMLIATMNPCPCGYFGDSAKECSCAMSAILAYQKRLSGPLLDRIDLTVQVSRVANQTLLDMKPMQKTQHESALSLIQAALQRQRNRYDSSSKYNNSLSSSDVRRLIPLDATTKQFLSTAADKLNLSARSYFKVIKVARTIADLEDAESVTTAHIGEALQYRQTS